MRAALRGVLGTADTDVVPAPDPEWRRGWPALAELGVTALCVPEDRGGYGLQADAAAATALEFGAALHGSPFAALTASAHVLAHAGGAAEVLLGDVVAGDAICTYGMLDTAAGCAWLVDGAPEADALMLVDPTTGVPSLFTDPSAWTVESPNEPFDVSRSCGRVNVELGAATALPADPPAHDLFRLLLAADAVGGVQKVHDRTVAYAGQRIAFGKPIGGFQAVQHRLADHAVRARGMALLVEEAAALIATGSDAASRFVAMASVSVTANASRILHDLLQLTGAIGFTWEYGLHFYERRAHHDARLAANPRHVRQMLATIEGWTGAA